MSAGLSVAPPETAHKLGGAVVAESGAAPAARPCLALVLAGFYPQVPPPPVRMEADRPWLDGIYDLATVTRHLHTGRAVAVRCHWTWCLFVADFMRRKLSADLVAAGVPHRVELRIDREGFKTLIFIPEDK
jgi:hypothetical protein